MDQGSGNKRAVGQILDEMAKQRISYVQLAARLRRVSPSWGWTQEYLALRLGELVPVYEGLQIGGRTPLMAVEIEQMAQALCVPVAELLSEQQLALATAS
jgi:hypothetical protein